MKIDFNVAKRKYYGCFNTIKSSVGSQANEIMVLHLLHSSAGSGFSYISGLNLNSS